MSGLQNPQAADHLAQEAGSFEPQRVFNFSVEIPLDGADKDLIIMALDSFKLPKTTNEKIELHYQNGMIYVAGKAKTDEGSLVLKDFADKDVIGAVMRWRNKVNSSKTGKVGLARDYKKTAYLTMTAPDGSYVRVCKLKGVFPPADPDLTEFNMGGNDVIKLTLPLSCDKTDWSETVTGLI